MLRVLHVVSYFPPDRMGGVGEVVAHIHRALLADGSESTVLTTGTSNMDPKVHRIASSPGGFAIAATRYASVAREAQIVHIHHGEGVGLLAAMKVGRVKTPVLLTLHVSVGAMRRSLGPYQIGTRRFHRDNLHNWIHRKITMRVRSAMDHAAIALADQVNFISFSAASDVLGPDRSARATVVYNGVPSIATATGEPSQAIDLLYVGANTERKRVELLPFILTEVRRRRPNARLRIVGFSRDQSPETASIARELGVLDAIEFVGRVESGSLGHYYRSAEVLLVPSAYEGLPMVILEAMQHGLPVVATRVSGHPEVIDNGVNGLLVPLDDPEAMAIAALRVLEDPSMASRFSAQGQSTVSCRFSVDRQVTAYLAQYEKLVLKLQQRRG